jgi:hypothetical protein
MENNVPRLEVKIFRFQFFNKRWSETNYKIHGLELIQDINFL